MKFMRNYLENLFRIKTGRPPNRPLIFSYYITYRCNLECDYCCTRRFSAKYRDIEELDTEGAKKIVEIVSRAADTLDITGGEPLLRDDLEIILAHARALKLQTVLNTNGIGIEARPDLMKYANILVMSLDALDSSTQDKSREREKIRAALEFVLGNRKKHLCELMLSSVITPRNMPDIRKIMDYAAANAVWLYLSPQLKGIRVHEDLRNSPAYRELVDEAIRRKKNGERILGVPEFLEALRDFQGFSCDPLILPVISPDGFLFYPCMDVGAPGENLAAHGEYFRALKAAEEKQGQFEKCGEDCHVFCNMGLSLLQRKPVSAMREGIRRLSKKRI
jgi:MoaA/NifB/PqqE/SkfB family radical SAM enzyme